MAEGQGQGTDSDFHRIFGIETEYGLSLTGASAPYAAGRVAMAMFRPLIDKHGSTNICPMVPGSTWTWAPTRSMPQRRPVIR